MEILFTTIFGSKLYGTDTPESDTDYKSIFLPSLDELIVGIPTKTHRTQTSSTKNTSTDVDIEYVPVVKWARDYYSGQMYAHEVMASIRYKSFGVGDFYHFAIDMFGRFSTTNMKPRLGLINNMIRKLETSQDTPNWKEVMHAIRVGYDGGEYLMYSNISSIHDIVTCKWLLSIRAGEQSVDYCIGMLKSQQKFLSRSPIYNPSENLLEQTPELDKEFEEFLAVSMRKFYNIQ